MRVDAPFQAAGIRLASKPVKLREVRFEDYSQIVALTVKFHLEGESYQQWRHLWTENPTYQEMDGRFPMGWVLEIPDGKIVGYLGNIPLSYELEGKRLIVATTRSWVVDTVYRSYSPLLLGTYFQQANVDLFLNTSVNSQALLAYSTFQGVRVPTGSWNRSLFWVTNYRGFAESLLRKKGWIMAAPLSYPLSVSVLLRDQFRGSGFHGTKSTVRAVSEASFDERFDAFWAVLRNRKCNLLLAVRSRAVLEWHFKFALQQNAAWIYILEGSHGLTAYSVFLRQDNHEAGLARVRLADFQCLEDEKAPTVLGAMLQAAVDRCRQESIHMLELIGLPPRLQREVERASPHHRLLPSWLYFYKTNDRSLGLKLKNAAVWEPSLFDGDSTL